MAAALMLDTLGESVAAKRIESSAVKVLGNHLKSLDAGRMGHSTSEVGDLVAKNL